MAQARVPSSSICLEPKNDSIIELAGRPGETDREHSEPSTALSPEITCRSPHRWHVLEPQVSDNCRRRILSGLDLMRKIMDVLLLTPGQLGRQEHSHDRLLGASRSTA